MMAIDKNLTTLFYLLLIVVYTFGMFLPVMENDSAQHATMAMRMYLENDFFTIMRGNKAYLDKPHMHFWLSAISFKIFGIQAWVYRIPALLFTALGAVSCYHLAKELYNRKLAHFGALIFLTSQSIFLANHDVRTDAVLTGATIFSIWQLFLFTKSKKLLRIVLGAIGMGIAFSTKGMFGVFIICVSLLFHLLYTRNLKVLLTYKIFIGLAFFGITIIPVLLAYHSQFEIEGVQFILWDQNFDRLNAENLVKSNPDYSFFFHTLLWVFLPWSLIFYVGLFYRLKELITSKFIANPNAEVLTFAGAMVTILILSTSQFKLPHYLNPFIPLFSVLVVGYLDTLVQKSQFKTMKILVYIQYFISIVSIILIGILLFFTFNTPKTHVLIGMVLLLSLFAYIFLTKRNNDFKIIHISIVLMIFINFGLNSYFYPELLQYQAGIPMLELINKKEIPKENIYIYENLVDKKIENNSWSFDFYSKHNTPSITIDKIKTLDRSIWIFVDEQISLDELKANNISSTDQLVADFFRVSKLNTKFLNPKTRAENLRKAYLLKIEPNK